MNFTARISRILSYRWAGLFIILFCIVSKSVLISFYSYVGKDKIYHLAASNNLLEGKGWTTSVYFLNNIDQEVLEPFCYWPPGYGLLMTPLNYIFGNNLYLSTTLFEIICFLALLILFRGILGILELKKSLINLFTLVIGLYPYEFIEMSLGTDLPALCFLMVFFYCTLRIWKEKKVYKNFLTPILGGFSLFMAGMIRYPYIPVGIVICILLVLFAHWTRNKNINRQIRILSLVAISGFLSIIIFQQIQCGSPFYVTKSESGIYLENLQYWYPAVLASFLNLPVVAGVLERIFSVSFENWMFLFSYLNLLIYFILLIFPFSWLTIIRRSIKDVKWLFKILGTILSMLIIAELAALSVSRSIHTTLQGYKWTFIAEGRYYAFIIVFLQLLLFAVFFITPTRQTLVFKNRNLKTLLPLTLVLVMLMTVLHQVYLTAKIAANYSEMKPEVKREKDYVFFEKLLEESIAKNPQKEIIVASTDRYYPLLATIHGRKGIGDPYSLNTWQPLVQKPILVYTAIMTAEKNNYAQYLSRKDVRLVKVFDEVEIYIQEITTD